MFCTILQMEIGEDGENGQHVLQHVGMAHGKEWENATAQELKEKVNIVLMMEVDVMKKKIVIVDTVARPIKVKYVY